MTANRADRSPRVALVHDWLVRWGGAERVLQVLADLFPEAVIHAGVWSPDEKVGRVFGGREIRTTFLQQIPGSGRHYPKLLPLMPAAFQRLDLSEFDLVVSTSHAFSKAVRPGASVPHVCYCHTPPRYLWDLYATYNPGWRGHLGRPLAWWLRRADAEAARRVTRFVANSRTVADRIERHYGREAEVVHPPVDVARFGAADAAEPGAANVTRSGVANTAQSGTANVPEHGAEDWFLTGGRLVPYKRTDLLVAAANREGFRLKVFGDGPQRATLERMAGPTVEILGRVSDAALDRLMARCRAFLFAAEEDFGILPVEAQAAGRPVVAWGKGGATETVVPDVTGLLVDEPTAEAFGRAAREAARRTWDRDAIRAHAGGFSTARFREGMLRAVGAEGIPIPSLG